MHDSEILDLFNRIVVWSRGNQRAPSKPLLILYALGALQRGQHQLHYTDIEKPLHDLIKDFGPQRKSYHPEYPFWRLKNDGIWVLNNAEKCELRPSNTDAKVSELREHDVSGEFKAEIKDALSSNPLLFSEVVASVLEAHFPETMHEEILESCGLVLEFTKKPKKRDPDFRNNVLRAYRYRCAICGFQTQLDGRHLALDAAHIKWHAAGGDDNERNGIAMCTLHHKLFDRGAFKVSSQGVLVLSEAVYGNQGFEAALLSYHGHSIEKPISEAYTPLEDNILWHEKWVFKGPSRPFQ